MAAKLVLFVCAQAMIQSISAQCLGAYPAAASYAAAPLATAALATAPLATAPLATACDHHWEAAALSASHGPGLAVTSASPVPPVGVSVASENAIEGALAVAGAVPFLGSVGLEGALPTAGAGAVEYNCGVGEVAILEEDIGAPAEIALAPMVAPLAGPLAGPLAAPLAGTMGFRSPLGYPGPYGPLGPAGPLGYGPAHYGGCGTLI